MHMCLDKGAKFYVVSHQLHRMDPADFGADYGATDTGFLMVDGDEIIFCDSEILCGDKTANLPGNAG